MYKVCALQRLMAAYKVPKIEEPVRKIEMAQIQITDEFSDQLLNHMNIEHPELQDYRTANDLPGTRRLLPFATPIISIQIPSKPKTFNLSPKRPNNCLVFKKPGKKTACGLVKQIYQFDNGVGSVQEAILVEPIVEVFGKKVDCLSRNFCYSLHLTRCIVGHSRPGVTLSLNPTNVIAPAAYRLFSPQTFGLPLHGIILKPVI